MQYNINRNPLLIDRFGDGGDKGPVELILMIAFLSYPWYYRIVRTGTTSLLPTLLVLANGDNIYGDREDKAIQVVAEVSGYVRRSKVRVFEAHLLFHTAP